MRQLQVQEVVNDVGVRWQMREGESLVGEFLSADRAADYFKDSLCDPTKDGGEFSISFRDVDGRECVPGNIYTSNVHSYFPFEESRPAEGDKCAVLLNDDRRVLAHYRTRRFVQINGKDLDGQVKAWVHANLADVMELERKSLATYA